MAIAVREIPGTERVKGRVVRAKPARVRQLEHAQELAERDREIAHLKSRLECAERHLRYVQGNAYRMGGPAHRAVLNAMRALTGPDD